MTMRKALLLILLLILPLTLTARPVHAKEPVRTYTIKKGDTLWGISQRFLKDPYYWPNLWSNNPFIANPHLIYPGQKVAIYDGRIQIVGVKPKAPTPAPAAEKPAPETPAPAPAPTEKPVPAEEPVTIKTLGGAEGFVSLDGLQGVGTIVDTVDNRLMMAEGDTVFCEMKTPADVQPGDAFDIVAFGKPIYHPVSGKLIGHQVATVGSLVVTAVNPSVATARITASNQEIRRGDKLLPFQAPALEVALKKAKNLLNGYIIASKQDKIGIGQNDVIYIDLGAADGLETGNLLYLTRPRKPSEVVSVKEGIQLPEVLLGSAVVVETKEHTAAALVLKAAQAVFRGDQVRTVVE